MRKVEVTRGAGSANRAMPGATPKGPLGV